MLSLNLKSAKEGFFNSPKVIRAIDKATRSVLSKFGAFVRTRAKTSMRKRRGVSPPGSPPYAHVGLLRKLLFFVYDSRRQTVVIGPIKINKPTVNGLPIPALMEHGNKREYEPRPYMGPALKEELPRLPEMWKNSVR